ncbi:MAG: hypothetical protein R2764_04725 [Bacteroidales bacterium]
MRRLSYLISGFQFFAILMSSVLFAQTEIDSTQLTLDRIFNSGEFQQEYGGTIRWLGDGEYYTMLERSDSVKGGRDIVQYDSKKEISPFWLTLRSLF